MPQALAVRDVTGKNRDRLKGAVAEAFFGQVSGQARRLRRFSAAC